MRGGAVSGAAAASVGEDCFAPAVIADPHTYYRRLRELEAVHWNERYQCWLVTGYDEVQWLQRHPELVGRGFLDDPLMPWPAQDLTSFRDVVAPFFCDMFIMKDRRDQLRKRRVVHSRFTPGAIEHWRPAVRRALKDLLDEVEPRGRMEVMQDLAAPLSLQVCADMMGLPAGDRLFIRAVVEKLMAVFSTEDDAVRLSAEGIAEFTEYLEPVVADRRRRPTEDLISVLIRAEDSGLYSHRELFANAVLLLLAGYRAMTNLMGNGLVALLQHPDAWMRVRLDPEDLARSATEECLRWHPSPMLSDRVVGEEPIELARRTLLPRQRVLLVHLAANRDPRHVDDPDVFLIDRHPNPHLSFGGGTHHHGLNSALARLATQEMFVAVADRFERLELVTDPVEYAPSVLERTPLAVETTWDPASCRPVRTVASEAWRRAVAG